MKKQLILLLFLTTLVFGSQAKDNEYYYSLALQGNEQYTAGNYDSALLCILKLLTRIFHQQTCSIIWEAPVSNLTNWHLLSITWKKHKSWLRLIKTLLSIYQWQRIKSLIE